MKLPINQIMNGDVLKQLKELPDKSINMVMTSPPYWALRDYGNDVETIWDVPDENDAAFGCPHFWKGQGNKKTNLQAGNPEFQRPWREQASGVSSSERCTLCGAWKGQLGLEPTFDLYIKHLCDIFDEVKRVLRDDGTIWVNLGDTYWGGGNNRGSTEDNLSEKQFSNRGARGQVQMKWGRDYPKKSLCMIPSRFAIEMINRGWILRNEIHWHKPNAMPSSVKDRFTVDFEYLFLFSKKRKYYFETQYEPHKVDSIKRALRARTSDKLDSGQYSTSYKKEYEGYEDMYGKLERGEIRGVGSKGRNKRTTWTISTKPFSEAHFAVYPEELCETPIKAGCPKGGVVLDIFFGSGTTGLTALKLGRQFIGIELNPEYIKIAKKRLQPLLEQERLVG